MFSLYVPFPFSIPIPVASLRREGPGSIRLVLSLLRGHITSQPRAKQTRGTDTLTLSHISHPSHSHPSIPHTHTHTHHPHIPHLTLTPLTLISLISHLSTPHTHITSLHPSHTHTPHPHISYTCTFILPFMHFTPHTPSHPHPHPHTPTLTPTSLTPPFQGVV